LVQPLKITVLTRVSNKSYFEEEKKKNNCSFNVREKHSEEQLKRVLN
jgi:hypothetical protein